MRGAEDNLSSLANYTEYTGAYTRTAYKRGRPETRDSDEMVTVLYRSLHPSKIYILFHGVESPPEIILSVY